MVDFVDVENCSRRGFVVEGCSIPRALLSGGGVLF
jgi:hypothetical protein